MHWVKSSLSPCLSLSPLPSFFLFLLSSLPSQPPPTLGLWQTELQGCYYRSPISFVHHDIGKKATPRKHRAETFLNPTVPFSVSLSLWLKREIIFPFQMTLFLSVKNRWPCYLVRAQAAATTQVTHSCWTVTHLTRLCPDQTYAKVKVQADHGASLMINTSYLGFFPRVFF